MVHRLVIASLFIGATAYAQAPGDPDMDGGYAPGQVTPVVTTNPCGGCPYAAAMSTPRNVMATRFAVGLSIGSFTLAPQDSPDAKDQFAVGQLSLRYRATYHLELELALGGGQEKLMDGTDGDREVQMAAIGMRYRFAAAQNWNWWIMGAIGEVSIASKYAADTERQDQQRPMAELGIGLERRFNHFALQAELRAAGTGETRAEHDNPPMVGIDDGGMGGAVKGPSPSDPAAPKDQLSGGTFTIGASYYF